MIVAAMAGSSGMTVSNPESDNGSKGLLPFLASCAARKQGPELHNLFRMELMRARYREHKPYTLGDA